MSKLKLPAFIKKPNFKNKKTLAISLLAVVALAVFGWAFFDGKLHSPGKKVYAQAAGHKVYEQEVKDLIGNHQEINDHDAAQVLADKYLTEALAKEQGITVTDQEVETQYGKDTMKQKTDFKYAYQNKVNKIYFDKLAAHQRGIYKGKMLVTHFSRNVGFDSPLYAEQKQLNPKLGNKAAIAADKKYAENLITKLYNYIKSGKITFDQAIKMERADPKIGKKGYPTLSHSGSFDTSAEDTNGLIGTDSIRSRIQSIKAGELTEPFVVPVPNSIEGKDTVESYFLVIKMDETSGGSEKTSFDQYLQQAKKRLEYEVNV